MAWSYRKNARHRNPKKDVVWKAVCNKTKRKTKNEMAGWRVHEPEKDGNKRMERQSKESRGLEAYCKGGQGPPGAAAPPKKKNALKTTICHRWHVQQQVATVGSDSALSGTYITVSHYSFRAVQTGSIPKIMKYISKHKYSEHV